MSITALVDNLKANGEDFEFYPTTPEIIKRVLDHYHDLCDTQRNSWMKGAVLDVGAGNGAFLRAFLERFPHVDLLAIERSPILMVELVKFAKIVGTDFHAQSFMSKTAEVVFCNPPYSEYAIWASRLIRECPAGDIYLVIPRRWKDEPQIQAAIAFREAEVTTIGSYDFEDGERRARAKVDVLHVVSEVGEDALFEKFFTERFAHLHGNMEKNAETARKQDDDLRNSLVKRDGLVGALVALYDLKLARLQTNYDKAASMDAAVLSELGLSVKTLITTLRAKLDTLKDEYWSELFRCLDTVTKRLTAKNRRTILEKIGGFKAVDFTSENIYAVLLWVIENANQYTDKQILDVFDDMINSASIQNYKSNQRVYGDGHWRYGNRPEDLSHISLDYRIVVSRHSAMRRSCGRTSLSDGARDFIVDLLTVANLLGFACATDDPRLTESSYGDSHFWKPGGVQLFQTLNGKDLLEVRAHLNGNLHLRLSQDLSLALNVAVGKLRGWIRTSQQAAEELGEDASEVFAKNLHVGPKQLLLGSA